MPAVLLHRNISRLEQYRHCMLLGAFKIPRGAEIHQHQAAVGSQHDIIGRNIPMDDRLTVHGAQRVHNRHHSGADIRSVEYAVLLETACQRNAFDELHHYICGVVLGKIIAHIHDRIDC